MNRRRRCDASAALGAGAWLVLLALRPPDLVEAAVLLAALALVPAAVPLAATPRRDGTHHGAYRWAVALQPVGAGLLVASALLAPGPIAAVLALPWVGVTLLLAAFALWRVLPRGLAPAEEALLDAGLLYLPVGALAVVAYRLELGLGYGLGIIHLTAAHYHYATFLLPVAAAALGRSLGGHRRSYRATAAVLVAGVPLVAGGITASPALEALAATAFAAAVLAVAALFVGVALRVRSPDPVAAALLVVAAGSVALTMPLAVAYAWGQWAGPAVVGVPEMVPTHGLVNALGFALPAVLAWRRLDPPSRVPAPGVPFSRLRGGVGRLRGGVGRLRGGAGIGPGYPERRGLAGEPLRGQVDAIERYAGDAFDPAGLDSRVRRFYERTAEYRLTYRARWHRPFRPGARLAALVTARVEQLNLPTDGDVHQMVGRCPALDAPDARQVPRFWVRTDPETDEGVFVATYGVHEHDGTAYVNVGMPVPGGNLSAVLVPRNVGAGLELAAAPDAGNDAGLYLLLPVLGPVRLPVAERFRVWPADDLQAPDPPDDGEYELAATHEMWLLGRQFLTISYGLARDEELAPYGR